MNNIFCVGDIHGFYERFIECNKWVDEGDVIIQVGDFGVPWYGKSLKEQWENLPAKVKCPVYFIDGNHENYNIINQWSKEEITQVADGLFYIPRGYVMEIFGKRFGFLGGGESLDWKWRVEGESWFPEERTTFFDFERLVKNVGIKPIDYLITHTPPTSIIKANFPPINKSSWNLPSDWVDESSLIVERAWRYVMPKELICGHMHRYVKRESFQILDINQMILLGEYNEKSILSSV